MVRLLLLILMMKLYMPGAGIITNGGAASNIIPGLTEMAYLIRTPLMKELDVLKPKITACFQGAAAATGCKVSDIQGV